MAEQKDSAALARQYAKYFNIEKQKDGESDDAFRRRVAGILRERNRVIEAHEALHNERYEQSDDVMTALLGAAAQALQGQKPRGGEQQVGDDIAAGLIVQHAPEPPSPYEVLLLAIFAGGRDSEPPSPIDYASQSQAQNALDRIVELMFSKHGAVIARVLLNEGYPIDESRDAFYELGYVAVIVQHDEYQVLHVSDRPLTAGPEVIIATEHPESLPSVVWKK